MSYKKSKKSWSNSCEDITIVIETLTGKIFEVKVSPMDSIRAVKYKIQQMEGIPISHQHLLFKAKELKDSSCVSEPSVALHNGATIKLVLSLRGGPISLVQPGLPLSRAALKSLISFNRENLLEELPQGFKMAVLVLRIGDQINLLKIVENVNDSKTPFSNDNGGSSSNLLEGGNTKGLEENYITADKVHLLKDKLRKLALDKPIKVYSKKGPTNHITCQDPNKTSNPLKLPAIRTQSKGHVIKSRYEFSKAPVLPDIPKDSKKSNSLDCGLGKTPAVVRETMRPKTCPSYFPGEKYLFPEDKLQHCVSISQPYFRLCVSACCTKEDREWVGRRPLLQHLDVPPHKFDDIGLPNLTRHRKDLAGSAMNCSQVSISSEGNIHFFKNNLNLIYQKESKREPQSIFNTKKYGCFSSVKKDSSEILHTTNSHYSASPNTDNEFTKTSIMSSDLTTVNQCTQIITETSKHNNTPKLNSHSIQSSKHKSQFRCYECKKRLSITNNFDCRCGYSFCSHHRYSESHHCTFDYKKENLKILEQANSASAPKLPKL